LYLRSLINYLTEYCKEISDKINTLLGYEVSPMRAVELIIFESQKMIERI